MKAPASTGLRISIRFSMRASISPITARAQKKREFNITLQRDFDPDAGTIELFPQEITRAFLNLIANGVYAATRRKTENDGTWF